MTLRLQMVEVARLAPKLLGDSADLVKQFLLRQQAADGGFKDRGGKSDLYYTVFGLDGLVALEGRRAVVSGQSSGVSGGEAEVGRVGEQAGEYLGSFGAGERLDFVHLCCLAQGWATAAGMGSNGLPETEARTILRSIERHRSADGGYNPIAGSAFGTAYGAFLALGACQDLQGMPPEPLRLIESLKHLETADGAFVNARPSPPASPARSGATNATAAAVAVLRSLGVPVSPATGDWLMARAHPQGGFLAMPDAPMPDLLSTATALHAVAGLGVAIEGIRENCLDFLDSLWTNEGGFHGHWGDDRPDCEYTFYGLLALGHLS